MYQCPIRLDLFTTSRDHLTDIPLSRLALLSCLYGRMEVSYPIILKNSYLTLCYHLSRVSLSAFSSPDIPKSTQRMYLVPISTYPSCFVFRRNADVPCTVQFQYLSPEIQDSRLYWSISSHWQSSTRLDCLLESLFPLAIIDPIR
jgi:hypothetical protein